ncbi:hypothetical protein LCGC14_0343570 [marine sediment metagenome]|uniref:Uncharacterized protein n=1 Tax=marine sediment metagenome TaxID=412755 RepID=A0A0F9TIS2_9ZZZZ
MAGILIMDALERAMVLDMCGTPRTAQRNAAILAEHQLIDRYDETPDMSWVELYRWLGY